MLYRTIRNRFRIPHRIAALAALLLVLSIIAEPEQLQMTGSQDSLVQQESNSSVDETATELIGVTVTKAKPVDLNISTLIFRF